MKSYVRIVFAAMFVSFMCQTNLQAQEAKVSKGKTTIEKGKDTV
jgi:hypothetical protein